VFASSLASHVPRPGINNSPECDIYACSAEHLARRGLRAAFLTACDGLRDGESARLIAGLVEHRRRSASTIIAAAAAQAEQRDDSQSTPFPPSCERVRSIHGRCLWHIHAHWRDGGAALVSTMRGVPSRAHFWACLAVLVCTALVAYVKMEPPETCRARELKKCERAASSRVALDRLVVCEARRLLAAGV